MKRADAQPGPGAGDEFVARVLERFRTTKSAWEKRRTLYTEDARMVNVPGGQWDPEVLQSRRDSGKPALEFNEEHIYVETVVNKARKDRPQPRVSPGDSDATPEWAEFLENRLRHIQYASQADVAYDTAVDCSATGGFGYYRIECEYTDNGLTGRPSANQEPRIRRILDPLTQYPDPACLEPDFSDARFWFDRDWVDRESFKRTYKADPIDWDSDNADPDWVKENQVCVCRYWEVQTAPRRYYWLNQDAVAAGWPAEGWADEMPAEPPSEAIDNYRDVDERKVTCHLMDGAKVLKTTQHLGPWIPIIPVLGRQVVVDGEQYLNSVVRFAHGAQRLKNSYKSGIANLLQLATTAPWTGPRGAFKDQRWADSNQKNYAYLEWDLVYDDQGQLVPSKPERNTFETPIQSLAVASMQAGDDIRRSVGYADSINSPSQSDLSGVAVLRRTQQQQLSTFHFEDNLIRSQFHCARVVLELDRALADTPRVLKARREDGTTYDMPVHRAADDGSLPYVSGQDPQKHVRMDVGRYDFVITSGPTYESKQKEEADVLTEIFKGNPALFVAYADVYFKALGYRELEDRAKTMLPPQVLAAQQAEQQGQEVTPQQFVALQAQMAQMAQALQALLAEKKAKTTEIQGKLEIERAKTFRDITVTAMEHQHDATKVLADHDMAHVARVHQVETRPAPAPGGSK